MSTYSAPSTAAALRARPMQSDDDFWKVRDLLIETFPITGLGFNWEIRRWDGWRFYNADPSWQPAWEREIRLWETADGRIVGVAHPDGAGLAMLEVHPDYRDIEEEMIDWCEATLTAPIPEGEGSQLHFFVYEYDVPRIRLLTRRGYERMPYGGVHRRMFLGTRTYPMPPIAPGYTLRTTRPNDEVDFVAVAVLVNAAFNRTFHNPGEYRSFTRLAPCFRHDLDLVAEAPDGSLAALVGVIYDEANRRALYEPVCTHPDHQRKGLARTLMFEGLRRAQALGAQQITVETGDREAANALYDSIGFTEHYKGSYWRKRF